MEQFLKKVGKICAVLYVALIICYWLVEDVPWVNVGSPAFNVCVTLYFGVLIPLSAICMAFSEEIQAKLDIIAKRKR